jgi:hypothetical protein
LTKRELTKKAQHVFGPGASVSVVRLGETTDGSVAWEVRMLAAQYTLAVRRVGRNARSEACEVFDNLLASIDVGGWNWKEPRT